MVTKYLGDAHWKGLSTDLPKPVGAPTGAMFVETDTDRVARYNGTNWIYPDQSTSTGASTYTIYIAGSTVKARNNRTGLVDVATADNTNDASPAFNAAINNFKNITGYGTDTASAFDGKASIHAGTIFVMAGKYKCKTTINMSVQPGAAEKNSINIVGEGNGTQLRFEPTTSLTNGVLMKGNFNRLAHMLIRGNTNTVNLVKGEGPPESQGGQFNWQSLEYMMLCGPPSGIPDGSTTPPGYARAANTGSETFGAMVTGQTGLYMQADGSETSAFTANWKVTNTQFFGLDVGAKLIGEYVDMSNWDNLHFGACETAMIIEGVQHNISNVRIEGGGGTVSEGVAPPQGAATMGTKGIVMRIPTSGPAFGGNINTLSNINIELHKLDSIGILLDTGINNNKMSNIYNSSNDGMRKFAVWDNARVPGANPLAADSWAVGRPPSTKRRFGNISFGYGKQGLEDGILAGNVAYNTVTAAGVASAATLATSGFINGAFATLQTGTAQYDSACVFYQNTNGNRINTTQFPTFYLRFIPNSTANIRIFIGLWTTPASGTSQFTAPVGGATANPLNGKRGIGLWIDTNVSTNWKICHNDGSATATVADFPTLTMFGSVTHGPSAINAGFVQAVTTSLIWQNASNPDILDGNTASVQHHGLSFGYKTSNVPTGDIIGFLIYLENLTAGAARTLRLFDAELVMTMQ